MKLISSRMTFLHKVLFPTLWFGFLALFLALALVGGPRDSAQRPPLPFVLVPVAMAAFGFFLFRKLLWDLADKVFDCGDHLVVEKSRRRERIELSNIQNVGWTTMINPQRVTLMLRVPNSLGREIVFNPPIRLNPFSVFSRSPIIDDLVARIDSARTLRAAATSS
jgi:hypothetical protein